MVLSLIFSGVYTFEKHLNECCSIFFFEMTTIQEKHSWLHFLIQFLIKEWFNSRKVEFLRVLSLVLTTNHFHTFPLVDCVKHATSPRMRTFLDFFLSSWKVLFKFYFEKTNCKLFSSVLLQNIILTIEIYLLFQK